MSDESDLAAARQRVAELEAEVQRLQQSPEEERTLADLRSNLAQIGATGALSLPTAHADLLVQIVQTAMHVLGARAGSLYLLDEDSRELVFEVAEGERAAPLLGQRLPAGQGLAGWVAATGQAIAVADVRQDPRWADDVAATVGYVPSSMLALPLTLQDRVIGVLQLLDKHGSEPFSPADMATLSLFAQQAAVAIQQSRSVRSLSALLKSLIVDPADGDLAQRGAALADAVEQSVEYRQTLRLAGMLGEIAGRGDAGRRLSLGITDQIVQYLRAQPRYG